MYRTAAGTGVTQLSTQPAENNAFDMKAGTFTVPTLCIRHGDADALDRFLAGKIAQLPAFFDQAPLVIDLSQLGSDAVLDDFPVIVGMVRGHGMIPIGVRGASPQQKEQARMLELAVMPSARPTAKKPPNLANPAPRATAAVPARLVESAVRSGQRIYAQGGDLVLTRGVSSGAEVLADGNIYAYGPVRGRMLAGVTGNAEARIFCRDLGAELVSIAGCYKVSEDFDRQYSGRAVHISLRGDSLEFQAL
jgi:septum site-determining protein MinC